jgi:hypothetical protein
MEVHPLAISQDRPSWRVADGERMNPHPQSAFARTPEDDEHQREEDSRRAIRVPERGQNKAY